MTVSDSGSSDHQRMSVSASSDTASASDVSYIVKLDKANKAYGKGEGRKVILDNLNMKVQKGAM